MEENDNVIYKMVGGKMLRTTNKINSSYDKPNFVIVCDHGDWSGFRTLSECEKQFDELEKYGDWFAVVER